MLARVVRPFLAGAAMAAALSAQSAPTWDAWLARQFPDPARADHGPVVDEAQRQGRLRTPADYLALKLALHAHRGSKSNGGIGRPLLRDVPRQAPLARPLADAMVAEVEHNDGVEYATPLGLASVASGDNSTPNDIDVFTFFSTGEFVTAEVQGTGTAPITDSMLGIKTETGQLVAFSEDISATNYLSRTQVYLPVGTWQLEVGPWNSTSGGSYDVVLQRDPVALTPLAVGPNVGSTVVPGTGAQTVWQFTLGSDATVGLRATAAAGGDLQLLVQLADGRLWFVNDDTPLSGLDPVADLDLPAGSYTVTVVDLLGGAVGYTLDYAVTPTVLPDLATSGPVAGSVVGEQSRRLYRLTLGAAAGIDLQTAAGATPIGDTIQYVFDSDLDYLCDVDDADLANPTNYYSRLRVGLPANTYYVAVRGYLNAAGDYQLTPALGAFPATGTAAYGTGAVTVAGSGIVTLAAVSVCTGNSVRLDSNGGLTASLYGFMDENGNSLGVAEWSQDAARIGPGGRMRSRPTVGWLPRGTPWLLSWHRFEQASTTMTLSMQPSLGCEAGALVARGRAGDLCLLLADFAGGPGLQFPQFGLQGWFCLPFGSPSLITVGVGVYSPLGRVNWFACPPAPVGLFLQHGDLFAVPTPAVGALRERRTL